MEGVRILIHFYSNLGIAVIFWFFDFFFLFCFQNLINAGPLIRPYGLEKSLKLINVGPTFIPDYRVHIVNIEHGPFSGIANTLAQALRLKQHVIILNRCQNTTLIYVDSFISKIYNFSKRSIPKGLKAQFQVGDPIVWLSCGHSYLLERSKKN